MSLLQFAENRVGSIYDWPRIIVKYLFIDPPTYMTALALISFFYGIGVPCEMAVQLFQICNDKADFLLAQYFFLYYETWKQCEYVVHKGIYYNMHVKKYVYIKGSRKKQLEIVDYLAGDEPKGFGNLYSLTIERKIEQIRANVR